MGSKSRGSSIMVRKAQYWEPKAADHHPPIVSKQRDEGWGSAHFVLFIHDKSPGHGAAPF